MARDSLSFPAGKSSNVLRGAFGTIFRRIACVPQCTGARSCEWRADCPYAQIFEPSAIESSPSGLADCPRPFVFRATHLDGLTVRPDTTFHFDLHLFTTRNPSVVAYFILTFAQVAREGLGPHRGRVELDRVWQLNGRGEPAVTIFEGASHVVQQATAPLGIDLAAQAEPVSRLRVRFVTPTELKSGQQLAARPEFGVLASRIRDRISTLRELYGAGPLELDFRAFGERAGRVRMTRCEIRQVRVSRHSSRTGQTHSLGGFTGEAEYEGELAEFVPYLRAARWTGVGRQTVWGKGEIMVQI